MSGSKKLMDALDDAAEKLLKKHFPNEPKLTLDDEMQIKAFAACVNWYGPRTKLGPQEDKPNEFTRLRDTLHGRRTSKRDTRNAETEGGATNGHIAPIIPGTDTSEE